MIAVELIEWVRRVGGSIRADGENLKLLSSAPLPGDIIRAIRDSKVDILSELRNFADPDFPGYEAALKTGALVICRRCEHYKGPHELALGWCKMLNTETAPDVPFTCGTGSTARSCIGKSTTLAATRATWVISPQSPKSSEEMPSRFFYSARVRDGSAKHIRRAFEKIVCGDYPTNEAACLTTSS